MRVLQTVDSLVAPVADEIRRCASQAEADRRLPDSLVLRLSEAGLFSIYSPRQFSGMDLPLPTALAVIEEVARHDGSTGWTVALGIGNNIFTSVLPDASAAAVLGNGSAIIAGAPAFGVRAERVDGGYRLTGRWSYNSGAAFATWIAAPAPIFDSGVPRMGEHGPEMVFFFVSPQEVEIIDTWHVTGLRATSTQDLRVDDLFVPDEMTGFFVMPMGPRSVRPTVFATIPFFSLLGVAQAPPVCLGLARRAIEEFRSLALGKQNMLGARLSEQVQAHVGLARAEALVRSARSYWYEQIEVLWDAAVHGMPCAPEVRAGWRIASLTAVEQCVAAVDILVRLAGTSAIYQTSPLERCWRDIHTAAQHLQVQDGRWETAGRVFFGLDPASPFL